MALAPNMAKSSISHREFVDVDTPMAPAPDMPVPSIFDRGPTRIDTLNLDPSLRQSLKSKLLLNLPAHCVEWSPKERSEKELEMHKHNLEVLTSQRREYKVMIEEIETRLNPIHKRGKRIGMYSDLPFQTKSNQEKDKPTVIDTIDLTLGRYGARPTSLPQLRQTNLDHMQDLGELIRWQLIGIGVSSKSSGASSSPVGNKLMW